MMKIECSRQVWTEWTNEQMKISISGAPYGAKNKNSIIYCKFNSGSTMIIWGGIIWLLVSVSMNLL